MTSRIATFSSSEIHRLVSNGKRPDGAGASFTSYVREKAIESITGQPYSSGGSWQTEWGNYWESIAFDHMIDDMDHVLQSSKRYFHENLPWSGAPDTVGMDAVGDIKSPASYNGFFELTKCKTGADLKKFNADYYWQLVSNSVLVGFDKAVLFVFMPTPKLLDQHIPLFDGKLKFTDSYPSLPKKNTYRLTFNIPKNDKKLLIKRVTMAANEMATVVDELNDY